MSTLPVAGRRDLTRRRPADVLLLAILLIVWGALFTFQLDAIFSHRVGWMPLFVVAGEGPGEAPLVEVLRNGARDSAPGVSRGDRLLTLGDTDLHGTGPLAFATALYAETNRRSPTPLTLDRNGELRRTTIALVPDLLPWRILVISASWMLGGAVAFWAARGRQPTRLMFVACAAFALHSILMWPTESVPTPISIALQGAAGGVAFPLMLRFWLVWPESAARRHRLAALWPWIFASATFLAPSYNNGVGLPPRIGGPLLALHGVLLLAAFLVVTARSYRRADAIGRRQLRWLLLGIWVSVTPNLTASLLMLFDPDWWRVREVSFIAMAVFPMTLVIALLRVNLFDVDRLLSGAAFYTVAVVAWAVGSETILEPLLAVVSARAGINPETGQLLLLAALAAGLVPVQRRLSPRVERLFFEDRALRLAGLSRLAERLAGARGGAGPEQAAREIDRLYEPRAAAAYERSGETLVLAWARGGDFPDSLDTGSALVSALRGRRVPLLLNPTTGAIGAGTLAGGVAVPVIDTRGPCAVLLLGPRRSGDVYTPTDTALLAAVASTLAFGSQED